MAAYAGSNTISTLNGLFKNVYGDKVEHLIPDGVKLLNMVPFSKQDSLGAYFVQPVVLGHEHGKQK